MISLNKKIILVHPPMYLRSLYGPLAEAGSELPPQGLCLLAAVLRQAGYQPVIIDATAEKLSLQETLKRIEQNLPAVFVGFSVYYVSEEAVSQLAKRLKKKYSRLPIVVGGGHVSVMKEKILEDHPEIDIAVINEGERTVIDLTKALKKNKNLASVKGLIFRQNGRTVSTPPRPFIEDLDTLPLPAWDLLPPLDKYYIPAGDSLKRWPSTSLVTSRGCPGNCFFCNKNSFGSLVRQNSPEYVLEEIRYLQQKFGIKDLYFQDDHFVSHRDWVVKFCRLLLKKKLDLTWACYGRTDRLDLPLLKLMKKAGCWQLSLGIESGSQKVLNAINKQTNVERNKEVIKMCREAGLAVKGLFMVGSFGETKETIQETKQFIKESHMTDFHCTFFTITPGAVADKIWPKYGHNPQTRIPSLTAAPSFTPFGLTKKDLIKAHKDFYRTFYLRSHIIWYFFKKLRYPHQRKKLIQSALAVVRYVFSSFTA